MTEERVVEAAPADVATKSDVAQVETKVEEIQQDSNRPGWYEQFVEDVAVAVFDKTKKFADTLLEASANAVEAVATAGDQVPDTTQQNSQPVTTEQQQQEDVKPERRSHPLLRRRGKKLGE